LAQIAVDSRDRIVVCDWGSDQVVVLTDELKDSNGYIEMELYNNELCTIFTSTWEQWVQSMWVDTIIMFTQ